MKSFWFLGPFLGMILPLYILSTGCKAGRPARKTLPDQSTGRGLEDRGWGKEGNDNSMLPGLPFYAADTTIDGREFTAIYLSNPEFDSLAFGIIKSYEPYAGSLLNMIAEQGIKGVLIDFRKNPEQESGQADFMVANHNNQALEARKSPTIKVVFLWDEFSSSRAAGFMNELRGSAMLAVRDINNKNSFSPAYRQDCFKPDSPAFND